MKVALVCPYDLGRPGGVQDQVLRLDRWLCDAGHETVVVGPGREGPAGAILVGPTMVVRANRSSAPIAVDPRAARRVRDAVGDVDVVHIHEPFMPVVSLSATRIRSLPTVGTFHADAAGWARRGMTIGSGITRTVARRLDVVTAVSDVARSVVDAITDVEIIPNGIDVDSYTPAAGVGGEPATVVFLGRDDQRKGLDVALEAWPAVRSSRPDARLRVVGAARDIDVPGVTFLGRVSEEEKLAELHGAAIAIAPNLGGESFGIIVAEFMAAGCAVVASAIPAFVNVVGDAGVLVAPGDRAGLAEAIVALVEDPAAAADLARRGRDRVRRFDAPVVTAAYIRAYEGAIERHGGSASADR